MNTSKGHLARALLEAPCLRTKEVLDSMSQDASSSIQLSRINVDGGMSVNNFMLQQQADFTNLQIVRKKETEVTGIGAAIAAGLRVKFWNDIAEVE